MAEEQKGVGVEETIPVEQPATETEVEADAQPAEVETEVDQTESLDSSDPKDRSAFIAMRKKIKELEEQVKGQDDDFDLVEAVRSIPDYSNLPTTGDGNFDSSDPATKAFLDRIKIAEERSVLAAQRAERKAEARIEDFEAWQKYPHLNPKAKKSEEEKLFAQDVANAYIAEREKAKRSGKKPPSLVEVADRVDNRYERIRQSAIKSGQEKAQVEIEQKQDAMIESGGTSATEIAQNTQDLEALKDAARRGKPGALAELLKATDPYFAE